MLDQPEESQLSWLDGQAAECGREVVDEVRALLKSLQRHDQALEMLTPMAALDALETGGRFEPGQQVGGWQIEQLMASGGQGSVYRARRSDAEFEQTGALKVLNSRLADPAATRRFQRERQLLASLDHPGIPTLLDGGVLDDGSPWLVTEFVDGKTLSAQTRQSPLKPSGLVDLAIELCAALSHAHRQLVAHLDLKPGNVMLDSQGRVRLLDFGIARMVDADALVLTGQAYTPAFAAPEQINQQTASTATDIYGFGAVLLSSLTGKPPFSAPDVSGLLAQVVNAEPQVPDHCPADLAAIILRCMRKQPGARYPSIDGVKADLEAYREGLPVSARAGNWRYRLAKRITRNKAASAAIILLSTVTLVAGAVYVRQQAQVREQRDLAQQEAVRANAMVDFLEQSLSVLDLSINADPTLEEFLRSATERTSEIDDPVARARIVMMLSLARSAQGQRNAAIEGARQALPFIETTDLAGSEMHVTALTMLSSGELEAGRMEQAESFARRAHEMAAMSPDRVPREHLLAAAGQLAWALMEQEKDDEIGALVEHYLPAMDQTTNAAEFDHYAMLAIMAGNVEPSPHRQYALAKATYERQQSQFPQLARYRIREAVILGRRALALSQLDEALGLFEEAEQVVKRSVEGPPLNASFAIIQQAAIHRKLGHFAKARQTLKRADPLVAPQGYRLQQFLMAEQIMLAVDTGRYEEAKALLQSVPAEQFDRARTTGVALAGAKARWLWATGQPSVRVIETAPDSVDAQIAGLLERCRYEQSSELTLNDFTQPSLAQRVALALQARCGGEEAVAGQLLQALQQQLGADHWMVKVAQVDVLAGVEA